MARAVVLELSEGKSLFGSSKNVFYGFAEPTVNKTLVKLTEMAGIEKHITYHLANHTTFYSLLKINTLHYAFNKQVTIYKRACYFILLHSYTIPKNVYIVAKVT